MITEKKSLERFRMIRVKKVTNLELQKAFDFGIKIEYRFRKKMDPDVKNFDSDP